MSREPVSGEGTLCCLKTYLFKAAGSVNSRRWEIVPPPFHPPLLSCSSLPSALSLNVLVVTGVDNELTLIQVLIV